MACVFVEMGIGIIGFFFYFFFFGLNLV
jgi:hypothetical protein